MLDMKIETFLAVCRNMNFTKAANELHITQSAVSQQVAALEDYYGTKLFTYNKRVLSLTKEGIYLRNAMESLHFDSLKIKEVIENKLIYPSLRVGTSMSIGNYFMPKYIYKYITTYPNISLDVHCHDSKLIFDMLNEGELDMAFVEGLFNKEEYESKVFYEDELLIVCGKDFDSSSIRNLDDLFNAPCLVREEGSGTRGVLESYLKTKGHDLDAFKHTVMLSSASLIKELLLMNYGISFLFRVVVQKDLDQGTLKEIKIPGFHLKHSFSAIWKKSSMYAGVYNKLVDKLIDNIPLENKNESSL